MENELLTELEQKIGYQFKDKGLLKHAMSHSSAHGKIKKQ